MTKEEDEAAREAHMRAFLQQGIEATKGIGSNLLPHIEYSANEDGSVSEKITWIDPKLEETHHELMDPDPRETHEEHYPEEQA